MDSDKEKKESFWNGAYFGLMAVCFVMACVLTVRMCTESSQVECPSEIQQQLVESCRSLDKNMVVDCQKVGQRLTCLKK